MDHIRPYLQGHPHIRRARHAREPNGIVEQRLRGDIITKASFGPV
jgi:hypothetical protein